MSELVLSVEKREATGKKISKQLRREGKIPGVFYFHGQDSVPVAVDEKELRNVIHSEASIIDLDFDGKKKTKCVIREVQWDPVYGHPLHVDFMGIKLTEEVTVDVPVHVVGTAVGVKDGGGIMQHILREITVQCLPLDIPEHIEVDVTELEIGDAIRVEDLKLDKVKILSEPSQSIVVIRPPTVVAEPTVAAEELEEEGAEPEVVGEEGQEKQEAGESES
ncbi:MAG: 50S ribosomal protein L25 [Calditrichaeota bacterium]|nr:MAG: 50S ribosomal protein L25 [Calditrichota bacterium]